MPLRVRPEVQEVPRSNGVTMTEYSEALRDLSERLVSAKEYL